MIEKHIFLEDIDPVIFYGLNNCHLQMIKSLFPKLRIVARDNVIRILGDEEEMAKIEEDIASMQKHVLKYNSISDEDILDIVKSGKTKATVSRVFWFIVYQEGPLKVGRRISRNLSMHLIKMT